MRIFRHWQRLIIQGKYIPMYIIDTNIHAAYLLQNYEDDALTKKYLDAYDTIALVDRIIPDFIIGEFETFIIQVVPSRYQLEGKDKEKLKQLAFAYIHGITSESTLIVPDVETVQRARDIYFENARSHYISFVDSLVLATAEQNNYTIFSKDGRLNTLAQKLNIPLLQPQK